MARTPCARRVLHRCAIQAAGLLVATAVLTACGGNSAEADLPSGDVVLYTSMPAPLVERLEKIFEGVFPDLEGQRWVAPGRDDAGGMSLTVVRAATGPLLDRIEEERQGEGVAADVIWLADPAAMEQLKAAGMLAPYSPPPDAPIPPEYVDPDGYYVAGRVINMVLAWNTTLLPDGLRDWIDLADDERRRAFPSPRSGAARAAIQALRDEYGDEFLRTLAASGVSEVESNGAARNAIVAGAYEATAVLDYMIRQARADGMPVDMRFPASGTVVIPSPLGVSASAANPDAAEAFIDFVLSEPGQRVLVEIGSFYPVRTDVSPPAGAPPLEQVARLPVDWGRLAADGGELEGLWREMFP